jgi:citrate synthase
VFDAMSVWGICGTDLALWANRANVRADVADVWPKSEHPPGFDPYGVSISLSVSKLLDKLSSVSSLPRLMWLAANLQELQNVVGFPLALSGVAAAALCDLGFLPNEGEMLYLLLRLPGAAAHALEQGEYGYKRFPFYALDLEDDPRKKDNQ